MCGVFGIFGHPNGKQIAKTGIWAEQHRGQDAAGIAGLKIKDFKRGLIGVEKRPGKVREVLQGPDFDDLEGDAWIAHVRYSTQGKPSKRNAQPHYTQSIHGKIAIVSNGDVVNMEEQKRFLEDNEIMTYTENDAELIAAAINHQVTNRHRDMVEAIVQVMHHVRGAFSALVITEFDSRLFAFRDPFGIRPLFFATIEENGAKYYMFASETCAFEAVLPLFGPRSKIVELRMVGRGEIVACGPNGVEIFQGPKADRQAFCLFELVYFSRPDSMFGGKSFQHYRIEAGKELCKEHPIEADLISPVPKSGIPAAVGYALASGIPYVPVIIENPAFRIDFGGLRTFIESTEGERRLKNELKFNYTGDLIRGKSLIAIDDSIVRGMVTRVINESLRRCEAKEIHIRVASPPYHFPCFYGIETKDKKTLAANDRQIEEIKKYIGADSLAYLSLEGLIKSTGLAKSDLCTACFDGDYPVRF
jgi:amidophosphoribosyltransferase